MFGDDLDPTVTTARVGFGGGFGHACERGGSVAAGGLCRMPRAEKREKQSDPVTVSETETSDD